MDDAMKRAVAELMAPRPPRDEELHEALEDTCAHVYNLHLAVVRARSLRPEMLASHRRFALAALDVVRKALAMAFQHLERERERGG